MKFLYRHLSASQLVILGLSISVLLMVLVGTLQWQTLTDMRQSRALVHTNRAAQLALENFRSTLSDAESGQFRFILSHNDANLETYRKLAASSSDQFKLLRSLTSDDPVQQKYLDHIELLLANKYRRMEQSISLEQNGDHAGALQFLASEEGRLNMADIESTVETMQNNEAQLLFQRQDYYHHNFKINALMSGLLMVICLGFVIGILLLLRHLQHLQSIVTLVALTEMIDYEGGSITIDEYVRRRRASLEAHGPAQIEAERILGLLGKIRPKPTSKAVP